MKNVETGDGRSASVVERRQIGVPLDELIDEVRANAESADIFVAPIWDDALVALEHLRDLASWASSMPDAGFSDASPRWAWWHNRPWLTTSLARYPSSTTGGSAALPASVSPSVSSGEGK